MALVYLAAVPFSMHAGTIHNEAVCKDACSNLFFMSCNFVKTTNFLWLDTTKRIRSRGLRTIVATSSPTEDPVVAAEPLTKKDLVEYLVSGCKPKEKWRIDTKHEKFGFEIGILQPMKYEHISELLNGIGERFDWDRVVEGDYIIGLKQGKQNISLEPGGQFELSGAPLETLHQTCAEVNSHLYQNCGSKFLAPYNWYQSNHYHHGAWEHGTTVGPIRESPSRDGCEGGGANLEEHGGAARESLGPHCKGTQKPGPAVGGEDGPTTGGD